eukprot:CAMPEP_0170469290 /NCGR_PEP_ID=MMETSP0123-20130129/12166_1 /TAXON_ID=182087 /ORGANISM="Favella ehrenbergii, Strain Fehren 1" /LENGTH=41 /DNA_ID= /DNA_START= /DNA_END= /DNA_ORIENTATION=
MAFTLFYLLEACLLVANAIAILNGRFLKKIGFHVDQMNMAD